MPDGHNPGEDAGSSVGVSLTPTGRVPVEHRFLGLDKRTFLPALIVVGIFVFWAVLVPAVNKQLEYGQTTRAGDVFQLAPGLTMDAQQGWGVESGLLVTDTTRSNAPGGTVSLDNGGVTLEVMPGQFSGTPEELLPHIEKVTVPATEGKSVHFEGDVESFKSSQGDSGVAQGFTTLAGEGLVIAMVFGHTGLQVVASGPEAALRGKADEIEQMIDSISYDAKKAAGTR
ncbi:MAG TPA: hypothetical protein VMF31_12665 [Solirubrobacterales bacterium]|nr:hypothetical protein [Solirubrobacterales bacterium]